MKKTLFLGLLLALLATQIPVCFGGSPTTFLGKKSVVIEATDFINKAGEEFFFLHYKSDYAMITENVLRDMDSLGVYPADLNRLYEFAFGSYYNDSPDFSIAAIGKEIERLYGAMVFPFLPAGKNPIEGMIEFRWSSISGQQIWATEMRFLAFKKRN
jgi:hypothetical protein